MLPHFYAEGMLDATQPESIQKLCSLHGWDKRRQGEEVQVWDAVLLVSRVSSGRRMVLVSRVELSSPLSALPLPKRCSRPSSTCLKSGLQSWTRSWTCL